MQTTTAGRMTRTGECVASPGAGLHLSRHARSARTCKVSSHLHPHLGLHAQLGLHAHLGLHAQLAPARPARPRWRPLRAESLSLLERNEAYAMKESSGATLASSSRWPLLPPGGACRVRACGRKANLSISATEARTADLIGAAPSSCARSSSSAHISGAARKVVAWLKHQRAPTWSVSRSWRARASRVGGAAPRRTRCSRSAWSCRARSAQRARARRRARPHQQSD